MKKTYRIQKFGAFGEGIAYDDGKTVFVKGAIKDETVIAKTVVEKKKYRVASTVAVVEKSPLREKPPCKYYGKCGGCSMQHIKYDSQLEIKRDFVADTIKKITGVNVTVEKTVPAESCYRYRNKLSYPIKNQRVGLYRENSHEIVDIEDCLLQKTWNVSLIKAIRKYLEEKKEDGEKVRHIVAREKNGSICIIVVARKKINLMPLTSFIEFQNYALYLNINDGNDNVILGDEYYCIFSKGMPPSFHPASFYQVNDFIEEKIYSAVESFVIGQTVIDAYCGAGNLTLRLADKAKFVYGIEICEQAVETGREKAIEQKKTNVEFICGDCSTELPKLEYSGDSTVVLDPPRKGVDEKVINALLKVLPKRIVYVSCNPATLARDLKPLLDAYEVISTVPYDMFPQTDHVETLVCLSKKSEKHISIDVEFGESDGQISLKKLQKELNEQKLKKKTTYKDIQKWVEENYGFKVHTAYIAEVKRDLGLPMYDAPNAVEELKRPRSHPTAEMSNAIKAALKHFEII